MLFSSLFLLASACLLARLCESDSHFGGNSHEFNVENPDHHGGVFTAGSLNLERVDEAPIHKPLVPPPPPPPHAKPCLDKYDGPYHHCTAWKDMGYCKKASGYYEYMKKYCEKTCEFCYGGEMAVPPKPDSQVDKCAHVKCDMVRCSRDEVLSQDSHECCPKCVKRPSRGCTPVYKTAHKTGMPYKGWKCDTLSPIVTSSCFGVCASAAVLLESGEQFSKCDCCHPSDKRKATTVLQCATHRGTEQFLYEYSVILSCDCKANTCAPKPAASERGGFTMTEEHMPEYNKMFHNIDEFNDKHKSY